MRKAIFINMLCILSFMSVAQKEEYQLRVYQNHQEIKPDKGVFRINKAPFQLVYVFSSVSNWMLIAGSNDNIHGAANASESMIDLMLSAESGGADSYFNEGRSISAWDGEIETAIYYEDDTQHTFDSIFKTGKKIYGVRTVAYLSTRNDALIVEEWPSDELIVATAAVSYSTGKKSVRQLTVLKLHLRDVPNKSNIDVKGKSFLEEGEAHFQEGCEGCGNLGGFDFLKNGKEVEYLLPGSDIIDFAKYTQVGNQVIIGNGETTFTVSENGNHLTDNKYGTRYTIVLRKNDE